MSAKKSKRKSLSEKVSEAFIPRPLLDPENDSGDETAAKFAEILDGDDNDNINFIHNDKQLSDIRKRNVKILSEYNDKYKGKISSRHELTESDDDQESVDGDNEDEVEEEEGSSSHSGNNKQSNLNVPNEFDDDDDDDDDDEDDDLEQYRKKLKNCQLESEPDESLGTDDEDANNDNDNDNDNNTGNEEMQEENSHEDEDNDSDYDSPGEDASESDDESASGSAKEKNKAGSNSELIKETDKTADIQKGLAVQNQLKMWEKLLEIRIHSQKILFKANSLPTAAEYNKLSTISDDFKNLAIETQENITNLLNKMLEMQSNLVSQFSETKDLLKAGKRRQSTSSSVDEPPTKKYATLLQNNFENFRNYQNSVLQKWYDRTKILTPGSSKGNYRTDFDVVKKIETVLLNKNDLIKKSQILKGNYKLFGSKKDSKTTEEQQQLQHLVNDGENDQEGDERKSEEISSNEIYDDTDFYHQQLRELIEYKANTTSSPFEMTKQFAELQKLRQKMKKKVDTRASKGRKIRYVVHNKLVNFMAPYDNSEWTDESKNELYRSLFAT